MLLAAAFAATGFGVVQQHPLGILLPTALLPLVGSTGW